MINLERLPLRNALLAGDELADHAEDEERRTAACLRRKIEQGTRMDAPDQGPAGLQK
jgi:hypothetical protein